MSNHEVSLGSLRELRGQIEDERGLLEDVTKERDEILYRLHVNAGMGLQVLAEASGLTKQRVGFIVKTLKDQRVSPTPG